MKTLGEQFKEILSLPDFHDPAAHQTYSGIAVQYTEIGRDLLLERLIEAVKERDAYVLGSQEQKRLGGSPFESGFTKGYNHHHRDAWRRMEETL